jgi:predicted hotdog family 3-hydroxylacyl-ACP dehydratase
LLQRWAGRLKALWVIEYIAQAVSAGPLEREKTNKPTERGAA